VTAAEWDGGLTEERHGPVVVLRVGRERALGALSSTLVRALGDRVDQVRRDPSVRVLVLTGTGRGFIAGADINEYHGVSQEFFDEYQRLSFEVFSALARLPQPTIAAVNGYALGGGFEVALACDMILAADSARFGLPEVKLGLMPGGAGTQRLARAVNASFAKEVVMSGRLYSASEMMNRGVVAEIHTREKLEEAALLLADTIAANAPLAVRAAKRSIDAGLETPLDVAWMSDQQALSQLFQTHDAQEGVGAFLEKRAASFAGR
jgi:enoyl-CoA hydratase